MSPSSRRRTQGFMAALKRTFSEQEDDSHIEEPSLDDIKRWLVVNPTRQVKLRFVYSSRSLLGKIYSQNGALANLRIIRLFLESYL